MDNFYEVSDDAEKIFFDVFNKKSFPLPLKFQFQGNKKQKDLIKLSKIADNYSFIMGKDILVTINEDILEAFDDESVTILFEQEVDRINMNIESGKIKLVKPDLNTFSSLVNKYGIEKVGRANKVAELYQDQQKDKSEEEFIV